MTVLQQQEKLLALTEDLIKRAKAKGVTAAEVNTHYAQGFDVQVRLANVERLAFHQDRGLAISVYFGNKKGTASTSDLTEAAITQVLEKACEIAKYTEEDVCNGLADATDMAWDYQDLDLYHPWDLDPQTAIEQLIDYEKIGLSIDKRLTNSEGAELSTSDHYEVYANSHGFVGHYAASSHSLSCCLLAEQGDEKQRSYDYTTSRVPQDLVGGEIIARSAAEKTLQKLGARGLKTMQTPVIFMADLARGLLNNFLSAASGRSIYMESSFLLHKLDHKIFPEFIALQEQPFILQGLASSPFDSDGVRPQPRYLVEQGIFRSYLLGNYSARKLNLPTTGNAGGAHNVIVSNSGMSFATMVKQMQQGLIVTELLGHGINLVTGDYSRGASGFWVEKGEIVYPVEGITIAGNLADMFLGIQAISDDIDRRGRIQVGSLLVDRMTVAG